MTESKPKGASPMSLLGEWDIASIDLDAIPPRQWLLGTTFCKGFLSGLIASGAAGKTSVRLLQFLSVATGRPLTGEHVFHRAKVLLICLEDDADEVHRRVKALMLHHGISQQEIAGWLYISKPPRNLLLAETVDRRHQIGPMDAAIRTAIKMHGIELVAIDPLVKAHSVQENDNMAMDFVAGCLAATAMEMGCAADSSHHTSKGTQNPGDADKARGATAYVNAARLVYSLTVMTHEEATLFNVSEGDRKKYIRLDSAKVNIAPPSSKAKWFRLIGIKIGNATKDYPNGDEVAAAEVWSPPETWANITSEVANAILTEIDAGLQNGQRFTSQNKAGARGAWTVVQRHQPDKSDGQSREIIRTWVEKGLLLEESYDDPIARKPRTGLRVIRRPT